MKALDLANYIVNTFHDFDVNGGITSLKLQKLMYYVKAWSTVANINLGNFTFLKWTYGPVNKEVWSNYQYLGKQFLVPNNNKIVIENDTKDFIDFVVKSYIPFDAIVLSSMTHKEEPWKQTADNTKITENLMKSYYSKLQFAKNFPLGQGSYYPVKSDIDYSFIKDMGSDQVLNDFTFPSVDEYLDELKKNNMNFKSILTNVLNAKS